VAIENYLKVESNMCCQQCFLDIAWSDIVCNIDVVVREVSCQPLIRQLYANITQDYVVISPDFTKAVNIVDTDGVSKQ